jgi:integrase
VAKTSKGDVVVEEFRGRLRLRWRHEGERYTLAIGLPDTPTNRIAAQGKANKIALDMAAGHFDPTLGAYRPKRAQAAKMTAAELFERFAEDKAKTVDARTLIKYRGCAHLLRLHFGDRPAQFIGLQYAEGFVDWLKTAKLRLDHEGYL